MYPSLEVEYMDGASVALELENEAEPDRIVRVDLTGWKSDHIGEFISQRLKSLEDDGGGEVVAGAWTAEIQSCSG
jgi:predicted GNAT superfamily acetyltransferase